MPPRIYADFHKFDDHGLILTCYGTLRDLSRERIRLTGGARLTVYMDSAENEDLEVEATVHYRPPSAGREGYWAARFDPAEIRYVAVDHTAGVPATHPCFECRRDLAPYFRTHGHNAETRCPDCGCSILAPIAPPETRDGG